MAGTAIRPLTDFPPFLRRHGFAVSPDQTIGFIAAVGALGPRDIEDIRKSGLALFSIQPERRGDFNSLFDAHFSGRALALPDTGGSEDGEDSQVFEEQPGVTEIDDTRDARAAGQRASEAEQLGHRTLGGGGDASLRDFLRAAPRQLPRRRSYRYAPARRGSAFDLRRTLRQAVRTGGEVTRLSRRARKTRHRRLLVLLDVSGSMKERTGPALRFCHALASAAGEMESFTLGTRLTRITESLKIRDLNRSLRRTGSLIADLDGGTRLGDSLQAFLSVPRYCGFARGAAVVIISDGLERGDPAPLAAALRDLSRQAWRLDWLTPLAGEDGNAALTRALAVSRSDLSAFRRGDSVERLAAHFLSMARLR